MPRLIYYGDDRPGITRLRRGRGFSYRAPDGTTIDDKRERARIAALAVPPAYEQVWISPKPNGHLQATGRDSRQRKQYRYHPDWRAEQEAVKYDGLAEFGRALPAIRRRVLTDLKGTAGEQRFAIAAIIAMLDRLAIRIGNHDYAETNGTYGATTLQRRHMKLKGGEIALRYTAKGGLDVRKVLKDRTLNRVLEQLHDLPGGNLISWTDEDDRPRAVTSDQVNAALAEMVETPGITAKTFRTWAGSEAALSVALKQEHPTIRALSEAASERLANTPTVARNSYIHPAIIDLAETDFDTRKALLADLPETDGLRITERALLRLIG